MGHRTTLLLAAILAGVFPYAIVAADESPNPLDRFQKIYDAQLAEIAARYDDKMAVWPADYTKALKELQSAVQRGGDLEGWTAIQKELDRFGAAGTLQESDVVEAPAGLRALQVRQRAGHAAAEIDRHKEILALHKKYIAGLGALKSSLTKEGKIEDALAAHREIDRASTSRVVRAAEFVVAMHEKVEPPAAAEVPKAAPPDPDAGKPAAAPPPAADAAKQGVNEKFTVYDSLPRGKSDAGGKPLVLRFTANVRGARKVTVDAELVRESDVDQNRSGDAWSSSSSRSVSEDNCLRLRIRSASAGNDIEKAQLTVQYFGRDVNSTGQVEPRPLAVESTALPKLTTRFTYVDTPPVSTFTSSRQYRSTWGFSESSRGGMSFYGVVVTLFDADGQLIYQGASSQMLEAKALTSKPDLDPLEAARVRCESLRIAYEAARDAHYSMPEGSRTVYDAYQTARDAFYRAQSEYNRLREERGMSY